MQTWQQLHQNPQLFSRYFVKEYLIKAVRQFFEARNYHELESPILAGALPQERYLNVLQTQIELKGEKPKTAYLIPSTETYNKKILAAGLGEHYVITKVFRGLEEISPNHSPEFTMLEWYHLNADYTDLMQDCEQLFVSIKKFLDHKFDREHSLKFSFLGQEIDLTPPWDRLSISEALEKFCSLKLENIQTLEQIKSAVEAKGYHVLPEDDWQAVFELIFANEIEPNLASNKPTFLYDYPKVMCPLTKQSAQNPLVCEKVELYIAGREIGNGYTELLDADEQEKRFLEEQAARKALGLPAVAFDHQLVEALRSGLPPVAGMGMGLDRVAMLLADAKSISEINYFPTTELFD